MFYSKPKTAAREEGAGKKRKEGKEGKGIRKEPRICRFGSLIILNESSLSSSHSTKDTLTLLGDPENRK